jgi:hypothetical protein
LDVVELIANRLGPPAAVRTGKFALLKVEYRYSVLKNKPGRKSI